MAVTTGRRPSAAVKRALIGPPRESNQMHETLLSKRLALPIFASDPLSSVAYATESALVVLLAVSATAAHLVLPISLAIGLLLAIVVVSYTRTVWRYERITIPSSKAIAIASGNTRWAAPSPAAPTSTTSASSVAYAFEESGSEAKIGSASHFGSSVSWSWPVCIGRPTSTRRRRFGSRDRSSLRVAALTCQR